MFNNRLKATLLALCAFGVMAPAAFASDGTSVVVTGGNLTITNPAAANFTGVTLNGTTQTTTAALDAFNVTDARGTGVGWHVTAQASQFSGGGHSLPVGSMDMSQPTVTSPNTTSPDPTIEAGPYTIDVASAVQVASAAVNEGMGQYDFSATSLSLTLGPEVYATTYNSTVTISAVTGP